MELFLLLTLITAPVQATKALENQKTSAQEIIEINEKAFSQKKIINTPSLCNYHNELLKEVGRKQLSCSRDAAPATKDAEVSKQLDEVNKLTQYTKPSVDDMIINMPLRK